MRTLRALPVVVLFAACALMATPSRADTGRYGVAGVPARCRAVDASATALARLEREWTQRGVLTHAPIWVRDFVRSFLQRRRARLQDCLRLNQVQLLGTHNSYHVELPPEIMGPLLTLSTSFAELQYTHRPLAEQLDRLDVRQFELDVTADPIGGLYANRGGLGLLGLPTESNEPALDLPGFKVVHITDVDFLSTCLTFVACLQEIRGWSDAHPGHLPLAVLVELKDDPPLLPVAGFVTPPIIDAPLMDDLDAEIRSVFPPNRLLVPDDVRGPRPTLEAAVLQDGWPTLGESRGRVLFLMDNGDPKRAIYRSGRPSLEGRVLFTNALPGSADAAFVKLNDPLPDPTLIGDVVRSGYVVRTRADSATRQSRSGDVVQREAALASGAQWVSTDYPEPDPRFTSYQVRIPGGHVGRCNPVNAPSFCDAALLETTR